jgi:hypothetical protein
VEPASGRRTVFEPRCSREREPGIGTRLVEHVGAYARRKSYRSVGLEVTDSNHRIGSTRDWRRDREDAALPVRDPAVIHRQPPMRKRVQTGRCRATRAGELLEDAELLLSRVEIPRPAGPVHLPRERTACLLSGQPDLLVVVT